MADSSRMVCNLPSAFALASVSSQTDHGRIATCTSTLTYTSGDTGASSCLSRNKESVSKVKVHVQVAAKLFAGIVKPYPLDNIRCMKRTREEVAKTIEQFIEGTGRQWDWDGFTSIRLDDPELEAIRKRCVSIPDQFPPTNRTEYCSAAGLQAMREIVQELRGHPVGKT